MNALTGAALEEKYKEILDALGRQPGILGEIFMQATNKISNAAILYRVVQMIDKEKWVSMSSDVKGEIYEGLLQKNAEDTKSGAGQYFTPRPLIRAMVRCLRPRPGDTVAEKTLPTLIQTYDTTKKTQKTHCCAEPKNRRKRSWERIQEGILRLAVSQQNAFLVGRAIY